MEEKKKKKKKRMLRFIYVFTKKKSFCKYKREFMKIE